MAGRSSLGEVNNAINVDLCCLCLRH